MTEQNPSEKNTPDSGSQEPANENKQEPTRKAPWNEENFDAVRAAKLLEDVSADKDKLAKRAEAAEKLLQEKLDAEKSDMQRAAERAERAEELLRAKESELVIARISQKYSIPAEFLSGNNEEEIEAKAKRFSEWAESNKSAADQVSARPKTQLKDGAGVGSDLTDFDAKAIADKARSYS